MKTGVLSFLLAVSVLQAQIRWDALLPVAINDPAMPDLQMWQQQLVHTYYAGGDILYPNFASWRELPFATLKKLFPNRRFFTNAWFEEIVAGKEKQYGGGRSGGSVTLVCMMTGRLLANLNHYGNYEPFGDLLAANKISIRSPEDAKLVWEAFCDLHQVHWKDQRAIRISESVWHLGDTTFDRFYSYYEVRLNDDQTVKSATLRAGEIKASKPK